MVRVLAVSEAMGVLVMRDLLASVVVKASVVMVVLMAVLMVVLVVMAAWVVVEVSARATSQTQQ